MAQNLAIQSLLTKRDQLLSEKAKLIERLDSEIKEIETAIEELSGKKVWEIKEMVLYDDEHPDYIKSSQEEI